MNKLSTYKLQWALNNSNSISSALRLLNHDGVTCPHTRKKIKNLIESGELDTTQFEENKKNENPFSNTANKKYTVDTVSKCKTRLKGEVLRRVLIESGKHYKCEWCGIENVYNNLPLMLQVDHIDGNYKNNDISNLRFMCPNCHSQTNTFAGKNRTSTKKILYCKCGNEMYKTSKSCRKCTFKNRKKNP